MRSRLENWNQTGSGLLGTRPMPPLLFRQPLKSIRGLLLAFSIQRIPNRPTCAAAGRHGIRHPSMPSGLSSAKTLNAML
jgi:hypothetical protein